MEHNCPSLAELQDLIAEGQASSALQECNRCNAMVRLLQARSGVPELAIDFGDGLEPPTFQTSVPSRGADTDLEPGSLISVLEPETGSGALLLGAVTVAREDSLEIAPLTTATQQAAEWDLLLGPDDSDLGYAAALEVWNHGSIGYDQVQESLGSMAAELMEVFLALWDAVFEEASPPPEAAVGPPVVGDDDPRLLFQAEEVQRAQLFWRLEEPAEQPDAADVLVAAAAPVVAVTSEPLVVTVGTIAREWMEREGWEIGDLARESGYLEPQLRPILEDSIDPCSDTYAEDRLSRFLNVIEFDNDDKAEATLMASIDIGQFPEAPEQGEMLVFNRDGPRCSPAPTSQRRFRWTRPRATFSKCCWP
jgi:hypothetical protein